MSDSALPVQKLVLGSRSSQLARVQAQSIAKHLEELLPSLKVELRFMGSPGDRDHATDLRESPPDFFTQDLDAAVRSGELDCAQHSAKDLPDPMPDDLDWCWLPWRADPRDVLVLKPGLRIADLPAAPRIGISSERRDAYGKERFPDAAFLPVRGTIEQRLAQLDDDRFDVLVIAAAALQRLNLESRITEWVSTDELPVPEGQGVLALTFRAGDATGQALRSLFVKATRIVGAGVGRAGYCTVEGVDALRAADVCLYDALLDESLLDEMPKGARRVFVGKRCGNASMKQAEISALMLDEVRRGKRVVRLKGGDPGVFGRLSEEVDALAAHDLAVSVIPGVSSLNVATTGTGLLPTRRGVSRGFCAITPMMEGGKKGSINADTRTRLPIVFFMVMHSVDDVVLELLSDGWSEDIPAAAVFSAGTPFEQIVDGVLSNIAERIASYKASARAAADPALSARDAAMRDPGFLMVGETAAYRYPVHGALGGVRVLLTGSGALQRASERAVCDFGGQAVVLPLITLNAVADMGAALKDVANVDWIVLTSPSAVRFFIEGLRSVGLDVRGLPRIMCCGAGTSAVLRTHGIHPDLEPTQDFGARGLLDAVRAELSAPTRLLRLRSEKATPVLTDTLRELGHEVHDEVIYTNAVRHHERCPAFDAVYFASASAVDAFVSQWGAAPLKQATVLAIGEPTEKALRAHGRESDVIPAQATVDDSISALATQDVRTK
ncbi:MAG: hydroxymethylbilane synthase [Kiritimatiellae bacterium]|nr:hydroxymethylbilane synthase [Kiritimatiellia bacterium]